MSDTKTIVFICYLGKPDGGGQADDNLYYVLIKGLQRFTTALFLALCK